jgi:RimJ/RimL family protein N-acetyltransferase
VIALRAMEPGDAEAQHRWLNDPRVSRYPISRAAVAGRLAGAGTMSFANPRFSVESDGTLIGYAVLRDVTPESRHAELDLLVDAEGLLTEAARAVCAFAFDRIGLHRVSVWVVASDLSVAAYEAAGFVREGVAKDRLYRGGRWHDCVLLGRLASDPA